VEIKILYEDEDFLVVNKPAGLMVHGDGRSSEPTLVDWLLRERPEIKDVGEPLVLTNGQKIGRHGLVHRLDKGTSGVLAVAKNQTAFDYLKHLFQKRKVEKIYHAILSGEMNRDDGIIEKPIGRSTHDFRKKTVGLSIAGKEREAVTFYRVLARGRGLSFVEFIPKTGRTHQIRVHAKFLGYPVLGDSLYGKKQASESDIGRMALHAREISFVNQAGRKISVIAPYPEDFETVLKSSFAGKLRF